MNSFRYIITLFLSLYVLSFISCRKDDICTQPRTPKLGLYFYDFNLPSDSLNVEKLTVIALPDHDTLINQKKTEQIPLALNVNSNTCQFILVKETNNDTLTFTYNRETVFISKSCGYKMFFHHILLLFYHF